MRNKWIILLTSTFILFNCQSDKEKYYYLDEFDALDMGYPYGTVIHKSKKLANLDTIIVHSDIVKFSENSSYIIALQKPNKKLILNEIESSLEILYKYNSEDDSVIISFPHTHTNIEINKRYKKDLDSLVLLTKDSVKSYKIEAKNIFENEPFYQKIYNKNPVNYYIIDKKQDSVFGNLNRDEFRKIKKVKGIKLEW